MSSEFDAVESRLRSLKPVDVSIDRDRLIYLAGARAGAARGRRKCWVWWLSTVAIALAGLVLLTVALKQPQAEPQGRSVALETHPPADRFALVPPAEQDAPVPTFAAPDLDGADEIVSAASPPTADDGMRRYLSLERLSLEPPGSSRIQDVETWSREQLQEAGISVRQSKDDAIGNDSPRGWMRVVFDTSRVPAERPVVMTAWFGADDDALRYTASRVERDGNQQASLELGVGTDDSSLTRGYVDILVWSEPDQARKVLYGYRMSLKRLIELSKK